MKLMSVLVNMDEQIGKHFEAGLADLKVSAKKSISIYKNGLRSTSTEPPRVSSSACQPYPPTATTSLSPVSLRHSGPLSLASFFTTRRSKPVSAAATARAETVDLRELRVVRSSNTGLLDFYYRFTPVANSLPPPTPPP